MAGGYDAVHITLDERIRCGPVRVRETPVNRCAELSL